MGNTYSKFLTAANSTGGSFGGPFAGTHGSASKTHSPSGQGGWVTQEATAISGFMRNTGQSSNLGNLDTTGANPRQQVLENFKEISRIMTQNFLTHKKLD